MGYITGLGFPFLLVLLRKYSICILPAIHLLQHLAFERALLHSLPFQFMAWDTWNFFFSFGRQTATARAFAIPYLGGKLVLAMAALVWIDFVCSFYFPQVSFSFFPLSFPAHQHCTNKTWEILFWAGLDGWMVWVGGCSLCCRFWISLCLCCDSALFERRWCLR